VKMCQIWWLEQIMSAERSPILGQMWEVPAQWATGLYTVYIHTYRSVSKCAHARINARGPTIGLAGRLSCHIGSKAKKNPVASRRSHCKERARRTLRGRGGPSPGADVAAVP
jgi:hypothetical protein